LDDDDMASIKRMMLLAAWMAAVEVAGPSGAHAQQDGYELRAADLLAVQVYLVGGGYFSFARNSNVSSFDITNAPGPAILGSQSGGGSSVTPLLGARVQVPLFWHMVDEEHLGFSVFFETGLQSGFGKESFTQSFQNTSVTAADFGSNVVREYLQVPLLLGATIPIAGRSAAPSALFDIYGGVTIDSWAHVLQGSEANALGQQGFYGQNRNVTADPTVGIGLSVPVGSLDAGLPIFLGLNAELQLRPGSVVTAVSNNFPITYYGTVDPYANLAVMARLGIAFGSR
jgi:hypothetical protein